MIGKIFKAAGNADSAVLYSYKKACMAYELQEMQAEVIGEDVADDTHLVAVRNVPDGSSLLDEFECLEDLNNRTQRGRPLERPGFHMVLNPGDNDRRLSEMEALELIDKIMEDLGYGETPYAVYYHDDIERKHFHVAGIRIGQDGKKIKDSFEEERLQKILWKYAKKYGYRVGNQLFPEENKANTVMVKEATTKDVGVVTSDEKSHKDTRKPDRKGSFVPKFRRDSDSPVFEQLKNIFEDALKWSFSTEEQFAVLLRRRYNATIVMNQNSCAIFGNDEEGKTTAPITSEDLGYSMRLRLDEQLNEFNKKKKVQSKKYVEETAKWAAENTTSYREYNQLLATKGVYISISWSKEGQPFGLTWIDNKHKQIWKGSETATDMKWLLELAKKKGWNMTRKQPEKRKIKPMRVGLANKAIRKSSNWTASQNMQKPAKIAPQQGVIEQIAEGPGGGGQYIGGSGNTSDDIYVDETKRRMSATSQVKI